MIVCPQCKKSVASRQVDAMVAEKVMGLPVKDFTRTARQPYYSWGGEYTNIHYAPNDEPYVVTGVEKAGCPEVRRINDYSTDDAWQVVEKMQVYEDGYDVIIEYRCGRYFVAFFPKQSISPPVNRTQHKEIGMAICKAALMAVGVEVECSNL